MKDLIEALTILGKYIDPEDKYPTHCEHDVLYVKGPPPDKMASDDVALLTGLSFKYRKLENMWCSARFGSC